MLLVRREIEQVYFIKMRRLVGVFGDETWFADQVLTLVDDYFIEALQKSWLRRESDDSWNAWTAKPVSRSCEA